MQLDIIQDGRHVLEERPIAREENDLLYGRNYSTTSVLRGFRLVQPEHSSCGSVHPANYMEDVVKFHTEERSCYERQLRQVEEMETVDRRALEGIL